MNKQFVITTNEINKLTSLEELNICLLISHRTMNCYLSLIVTVCYYIVGYVTQYTYRNIFDSSFLAFNQFIYKYWFYKNLAMQFILQH